LQNNPNATQLTYMLILWWRPTQFMFLTLQKHT